MEYKYRCKSREDSVAVQKALFNMGYRWKGTDPLKVIPHAMFLYINEDTRFIMMSSKHYFETQASEFPELIL